MREISDGLNASRPAVSQHLRVLKDAILQRPEGHDRAGAARGGRRVFTEPLGSWWPPTRLVAPPLLAWTIGTISVVVGWLAVELAPAEQFDTPASVLVPGIRREAIP